MKMISIVLAVSTLLLFALKTIDFVYFEECRYQAICLGVQQLNTYKTSFPTIGKISRKKRCKGFNYYFNKELFYYIDEHFSSRTSLFFKNRGTLHP